jgi:putative transposase
MATTHLHLAEYTEEERALASQRFSVIRPFFEDGVALAHLAHQRGIAVRTVQCWAQHYQQFGLVGLVRRRRSDRGHLRNVPPDLQHFIEGLALQRPASSIAHIHRRVVPVAEQQGWPVPSYDVVYDLVRALDPALVAFAHDDPTHYRETFDLLHRREATAPNEIWQADHTLLDIWLWNEAERPGRPWLTVILDDYSRAVAGYRLSFQAPSAFTTALTLRQAIWRKSDPHWHVCGIPATFYTDHGSDFTSRHLEQVSADLKMALNFSYPGVPRGRGRIERFFRTVNQLFLCGLPGYIPDGHGPVEAVLTLPELEARLHAFLLDDYHRRTHSTTGCAPQARWEARGFLPQLPETLEALDLLLLTVAKPRRVHQDGIHFQGLRYLDTTLAAYVGEDVTIRYDPRDMAEIRVFHHDQFVCRAVCQDIADQMISLKEVIRARTERRRQLRVDVQTRVTVVDRLLAVHQPASPLPVS